MGSRGVVRMPMGSLTLPPSSNHERGHIFPAFSTAFSPAVVSPYFPPPSPRLLRHLLFQPPLRSLLLRNMTAHAVFPLFFSYLYLSDVDVTSGIGRGFGDHSARPGANGSVPRCFGRGREGPARWRAFRAARGTHHRRSGRAVAEERRPVAGAEAMARALGSRRMKAAASQDRCRGRGCS